MNDMGPPGENNDRAPQGDPARVSDTTTTNAGDPTDTGRRHRPGHGAELLAQVRRRYRASLRMAPLPSGRRDPLRPADLAGGGR